MSQKIVRKLQTEFDKNFKAIDEVTFNVTQQLGDHLTGGSPLETG